MKRYKRFIEIAKIIDTNFKRQVGTDASFIAAFDSLYANKMIIDEIDDHASDYHFEILEAFGYYDRLLNRFVLKSGFTREEAHYYILQQLSLKDPGQVKFDKAY